MSNTRPPHHLRRRIVGLACCMLAMVAHAQQDLRMPSEVRVDVGRPFTILISGDLTVPPNADVSIEFAYTPSTVRPLRAMGDAVDAMACPDIKVSGLTVSDRRNGSFALACAYTKSVDEGGICRLEIEGLPGPDTIGELRITRVLVNGQQLDVPDLPNTSVIVSGGATTVPMMREGITGNFPNPFQAMTRIEYVVSDPGIVELDIRDISGRLFMSFDPVFRTPGTYAVEFRPNIWELSSGHYLVRLTTPTGTYLHTIAVQK